MSSKQPTHHARTRFTIRGENANIPLRHAWEEAFPVDVTGDEGAETRFYSPKRLLLYARDNKIVTAKRAEYESWYSPHVSRCSSCEEQYDPHFHSLTCPFCGHDNSTRLTGEDDRP